jgi:hypothetical protein
MKIRVALSALLLGAGTISYGQALPTATATATPNPFLPPLDGVVHYALSASEIVQLGYYGSGVVSETTALSGDVAYQTTSQTKPFNLLFAGGILFPNQQGQGVSGFVNAAVSQGLITRNWNFNVSDSFSFLPESPTTGLSGIAGVGDLGVIPIQSPTDGPAGGILSISGDRIGNTVTGSLERNLDRSTSISGLASWSVLRFLGGNEIDDIQGLDSSQISGIVSLNRRLNARSSASVNAVYSTIDFTGVQSGLAEPNIQTRGINFVYTRTLSRTLSASASVGPQWVSSSDSALVPASLNVAVSASLFYSRRNTNASVNYSRGVNAGSGVIPGAFSNSISAGAGHAYGRNWVASVSVGYVRTSGLTQVSTGLSPVANATFDSVYGGAQVTRRISTSFSGYVSYTAQNQSFNDLFAVQNAFSGTSQTFGIGVTFSPRSTRLGQF